ncbi:colony stimulating factor 3 (granulocyte) a isoform X2 [Channa argus]
MASLASGAPLPEEIALVGDPKFQDLVQKSRSITKKILDSIHDTHKSCISTQTLRLDSPETSKLAVMASNIGISSAPVLKVVSEEFTLETSLTRMSEGLQLHRALLNFVSPHLPNIHKVTELVADIRDLTLKIDKMLKIAQTEAYVQPTPISVALRLPGEYEVQVAAHLMLVQLQTFGQDMIRCLRDLDKSNDEETES